MNNKYRNIDLSGTRIKETPILIICNKCFKKMPKDYLKRHKKKYCIKNINH